MTFNNIKRILRFQIKKKVQALWTFDEERIEFVMIYKNYSDDLRIYTPEQLLERLKERENEVSV
tara:strand:+ start:571 stop:762 length:192 start_codon:yes stop_codon:yes gene_type:complete